MNEGNSSLCAYPDNLDSPTKLPLGDCDPLLFLILLSPLAIGLNPRTLESRNPFEVRFMEDCLGKERGREGGESWRIMVYIWEKYKVFPPKLPKNLLTT